MNTEVSYPLNADKGLTYRLLTPQTWPDFKAMFAFHKGVRGGCWCLFHQVSSPDFQKRSREERHDLHKQRVEEGLATGAIVYEGEEPIAWAQFGRLENFEQVLRQRGYKTYRQAEGATLADWVITCLFVDKRRRKEGLQREALHAALDAIRRLGGGVVDAFPFDFPESSKPQYPGTPHLFESEGFRRETQYGIIALYRKEL